jgi:hypothetical protein
MKVMFGWDSPGDRDRVAASHWEGDRKLGPLGSTHNLELRALF